MNVLYFSYWNSSDPLTEATVIPHLEILSGFKKINSIIWVNVEREKEIKLFHVNKVVCLPFFSATIKLSGSVGQILDFIMIPKKVVSACSAYNIDIIIARGAPAGALINMTSTKIPYIVESFEPHSDYMRYSNTWSRFGLKYFFQKKWEKYQKKNARFLLTVSENYREILIGEKIDEAKVKVVPCEVDLGIFRYHEQDRQILRRELFWDDCIVGVYAGKFGGIYEDFEAFKLFKEAFNVFGDSFRLLILTSMDSDLLQERLSRFGIDKTKVKYLFTSRAGMVSYLSASDFGFVTVKTTPASRFCSAIKIGEYWAVGLPIIIASNIGDDSDIVIKENIGSVYSETNKIEYHNALERLKNLMRNSLREKIVSVAMKYRTYERVKDVYDEVLE